MSINILFRDERSAPFRYGGRRVFRDSGVKRSFLLGIVPEMKDEYHNFAALLDIDLEAQMNVSKNAYHDQYNGNDCASLILKKGVETLRLIIGVLNGSAASSLRNRKRPKLTHSRVPATTTIRIL